MSTVRLIILDDFPEKGERMGAFFDNIFNSPYISTFTVEQFLLVMLCAVFVGMMISVVYAYNNEY